MRVLGSLSVSNTTSHHSAGSPRFSGSEGCRSLLSNRFGGVAIFVFAFLAFSLVARLALISKAKEILGWDFSLGFALVLGFGFDLLTALLCSIPLTLWLAVVPQRFFETPC